MLANVQLSPAPTRPEIMLMRFINHKGKMHPNGNFSLSSNIKEACRDVKALRGIARIKLAHPI